MKKTKKAPQKPHVTIGTIGTIGHVDLGKTTLTEQIKKALESRTAHGTYDHVDSPIKKDN